jgi:serine/threonine-protein kinase
MTPERFRQIDELISLVLEHEERDRKAFLDEACAGDGELRREVESLLACDEKTGTFLGRPAVQLVERGLAEDSEGDAKESETATTPPSAVGRYHIERELGRGGMGSVYAGYDPELGRKVAIKLIRPELVGRTDPSQSRARLLREAQALAQVTHPNVIDIHDVGTFKDQVFIAMEYVEGLTLTNWLAAKKRTRSEIVGIFVQAGRGLAAAHAKGIVHRDFKPDNVCVGEDGRARVLDFGLARAIWTGIGAEPAAALEKTGGDKTSAPRIAMLGTRLTEPGKLLGTPHYMAPEQLNNEPVDARTDQFSFCVALHQALHGEFPFTGESVGALLAAIKQRRIDEPKSTRAPSWLRRLLRRGMSPDPAHRFESMDRLLEQLDHRPVVARRRILVASALALLATVLVFGRVEWGRDGLSAGQIRSLVVLPLETLAPGLAQGQDYFAEGITDALTTDLAQIKALRVISRTSAMRYRGRKVPLSQIGRELKVDAVVEGTVVRLGERVRISVHLVDARSDHHVWAENYESDLRDILALQRNVARAIADQIRIHLTSGEQTRFASARQVNPDAYEAYARGRYFWNKRTADGFYKALAYFNDAIERDPDYALAHAGLADTYNVLALYGVLPSQEAFPQAKRAAIRALELDDGLAEAHTSLARFYENYGWDWLAAEREFRRAIELNPGYATGHDWYATYLSAQGRHEEALAEGNKAHELDPFSLTINTSLGTTLAEAGREDAAIERLHKTVEMDANFSYVHFQLGRTYLRKMAFVEAIAEFQKAAALSPTMTRYASALAHAYARAGRSAEARQVLENLVRPSEGPRGSWTDLAIIHAGLGEADQAFAALEKAYAGREWRLARMKVEPMFDPVRTDPRFAGLLRRMGLPQ